MIDKNANNILIIRFLRKKWILSLIIKLTRDILFVLRRGDSFLSF